MTMLENLGVTLLMISAAGCGTDSTGGDTVDPPHARSALERCVLGGGAMKELWSTSNLHGAVTSLAVGGTTVVLGSVDGSVKIWRTDGTSPVYGVPFLGATGVIVDALAFASDGIVLGADKHGQLSEWRLSDSEATRTTTIGEAGLSVIAVSEHADLAAVASGIELPQIRLVDRRSGTVTAALTTSLWGVTAIGFGRGGGLFTAGHFYNVPTIERRSTDDANKVIEKWQDETAGSRVSVIALDAGVTKLVTAGDGFVAVLDPKALATGAIVTHVPGHDVVGITLLPGADVFVTAGKDGTLRAWSAVTAEPLGMLPIAAPIGLGIDAKGERLFTSGPDGNLRAFGCQS